MSALDPQAIENKKLSLDQASQAKRAWMAPLAQPEPEPHLTVLRPAPAPELVPGVPARTEYSPSPETQALLQGLERYSQAYDKRNQSWTKDRDLVTPVGLIKQGIGNAIQSAQRMEAWALNAPDTINNMWDMGLVPDDARDIHTREQAYQSGLASLQNEERQLYLDSIMSRITPEEFDLRKQELDRRKGRLSRPSPEELEYLTAPRFEHRYGPVEAVAALIRGKGYSYQDRLERVAQRQKRMDARKEQYEAMGEGLVNPLNKENLDYDQSKTWDRFEADREKASMARARAEYGEAIASEVLAASRLAFNTVRDGVNNPGAVFEYVMEQVPQWSLGAAGKAGRTLMAASNATYGLDIYSQGLEDFRKENGRYATQNEQALILAAATSAFLAEQLGDSAIVDQFGKGLKGKASSALGAVLAKSGSEAAQKIASRIVDNALTRTAAATVGGFAKEAATEGYQTAVEDGFSKLRAPDAETVYKGAATGGLVGGTASGTLRAAGEALGTNPEKQKAREEAAERQRPQREAFDRAVDTGDVADLIDTSKPETYAPGRAVEALVKRAQEASLTPEEREATAEQARSILSGMKERVREEENKLAKIKEEAGLGKEETFAALEKSLKQQLKALPKGDDKRTVLEELLTEVSEAVKNEEYVARQIKLAEQAEALITAELRPREEEVESLVTRAVSTEATPEAASAATRILTLAMTDPDAVSLDALDSLVSSSSANITPEQRDTFRVLRDAQSAIETLKTAGDVNNDVLYGGEGFKGLTQYRAKFASALRARDRASVDREIEQLKGLQLSHSNKLKRLQTAVNAMSKNPNLPVKAKAGNALYLVKGTTPGSWGILRNKPKGWTPGPDTGRILHMSQAGLRNAKELLGYVEQETDAINKTLAAMTKARSVHFGQPSSSRMESAPSPRSQPVRPRQETPTEQAWQNETVVPPQEEIPLSVYEDEINRVTESDEDYATSSPQQEKAPAAQQSKASPVQQEVEASSSATDVVQEEGVVEEQAITVNEQQDASKNTVITEDAAETVANPESTSTVVEEPETAVETAQEDLSPTETTQEENDLDAALREAMAASETVDEGLEVESGIDPAFDNPDNKIKGNLSTDEFRTKNLLAGFVSQRMDTNRPLVAMKNFFSSWLKDPTLVDYFRNDNGKPLTNQQKAFLAKAQKVVKSWGPKITANLNISEKVTTNRVTGELNQDPKLFRYKDPIRYFRDPEVFPDGIPENWRAAIGLAAFSWATEQAQGSGWNTMGDIRRQLGKDKTAPITGAEVASLIEGSMRHLVVSDLGKRIVEMLNTKISPDAPVSFRPVLEASLGNQALAILLQEGWVEEFEVLLPQDNLAMNADEDANADVAEDAITDTTTDAQSEKAEDETDVKKVEKKPTAFIRVIRDDLRKPVNPVLKSAAEDRRGTHNVLENIFGMEKRVVGPSLVPGLYEQERIRNTSSSIPPKAAEILREKVATRPHRLNTHMMRILDGLSPETANMLFGVIDAEDNYVHAEEALAQRARNEEVIRDLNHLRHFRDELIEVGEGEETPFYLTPVMYKQQRTGQASNTINTQSSKIHRAFVYMEDWATEIDPRNSSEAALFKLAVAQGLGVKVDKQSLQESLDALEKKLEDPIFSVALAAIYESRNTKGELPKEQQEAILEAILAAKADNGAHALLALVELDRFYQAEAAGKPFITHIYFEVDGLTNGPAFAHILAGVINPTLGEKIGFYTEDSRYSNFIEWFAESFNNDLYESLMFSALSNIQQYSAANPSKFKAVETFLGSLMDGKTVLSAGRNLAKPAVTPIAFGASVEKTLSNTADVFVESFHQKLQKVANDLENFESDEDRVDEINRLIHIWNTEILGNPDAIPFVSNPIEAMTKTSMTPAQKKLARDTFQEVLGNLIEVAMNTQFAGFFSARQTMNDAAITMFEAYDKLYKNMKEALIEHRIKQGKLPVDSKGNPITTLSEKDERIIRTRLESLLPAENTPLSKDSGGFKAGLELFKSKVRLSSSPHYSVETKLGRPLPKGKNGRPARRIVSRGAEQYLASPGVATGVLTTHSFDSAVGMDTYSEFPLLNVHDGFGAGLKDVLSSAQALNRNTFKRLVTYSFPMELLATWDRMLANMGKLAELGLSNEELEEFRRKRDEYAKFAYEAEEKKLNYLSTVKTVQQYVVPGGEYHITPEDKRMVDAHLKKLHQKQEKEGIYRARKEAKIQLKKFEEGLPRATSTPWGVVGTPRNPSNSALMAALRNGTRNGTNTLKGKDLRDFIKVLGSQIRNMDTSAPVKQFQLGLLRLITQDLGKDLNGLEVRLITPKTPLDTKGMENDRGWYALHDNVLSIKSNEFINSAVTPELLLHELTHAALAARITKEMDKPPKERSEAVKELIKLVEAVRDYIDSNDIKSFHSALGGKRNGKWNTDMNRAVNELVAWGMTNRAFQTQILEKVEFRSSNRGLLDTVKNGLKTFVDSLLGLLFGKHTPAEETAMTALVINTGLLFDLDNDTNASQRKKVFRQESTDIETMTTAQVFDALVKGSKTPLSPEYTMHLREVLDEVVSTVYGPFGAIPAFAVAEATMKPEDTLINAISSGEMPFAAKALGYVKLTDAEAFVLESVQVTLQEAINRSQVTREEVRRVWRQARKELKPETFYSGDWSKASPDEKARAKEIYDFIFSVEQQADGTSNYLSQFAALALAYQPLREGLKSLKEPGPGPAPVTLAQKIKAIFNRAMRFLAEKIARIQPNQTLDAQMVSMTKNLARLEAKHKAALQARLDASDTYLDRATEFIKDLGKKGTKAVANSDIVAWANQYQETPAGQGTAVESLARLPGKAARTAIRAIGTAAKISAGDSLNDVLDGAASARNRMFQEKLGFLAETINEIRGANDSNKQFHILAWAANKHEQERKHIKDGHAAMVRKQFLPMNKQESSDVTRAVLRTDLVSLLQGRSVARLVSYLSDSSARDAEIQRLEAQLTNNPFRNDYLIQAKGLGHVMATGIHSVRDQGENAYVIARWEGNARRNIEEKEAAKAEKILDQLISLYAIKYLPPNIRESAARVMEREMARQDGGNGALFILRLHDQLKSEALENNFQGNPLLMRKGYVKEIFNPNTHIVFEKEEKGRIYVQAGYSEGIPLWKDPADPTPDDYKLYAVRGLGMDSRVTGIFSDTDVGARGTSIKGREGNKAVKRMIQINAQVRARTKVDGAIFDPRKAPRFARPVRNGNGQIVDYVYEMQDTLKDDLLERDNRLDQVIGVMASNSFDKAATPVLNRQAVEAFKLQYQKDLGLETEAYIEFSPNSKDPEIRERYALLPEATKKAIKEIWGEDKMMIRNDLYNKAFGFKKMSVRDLLPNEGEDITGARAILAKTLIWAMNLYPGKEIENLADEEAVRLLRAKLRLKMAGDIWVELVRAFKDNVVIKNFVTLAANTVSNTWLLWLYNVPPQNIVRDSVIGFKAAVTYRADQKRLLELQRLVDIGMVPNLADAMLEIAELKDALKRNPIAPLAEAGLMQTIVEDVEVEQDPYSYKSRLMENVDRTLHMVPEKVKRGAKIAVLAQGTPLYNVLAQGTTLSDFVARFVLYKHLTEGRRKPMSPADALLEVSEAFVNYDIPTHRYLQYLNDTGFVPFTKYYLRSQKILFRRMHEEPARMLAMSLMANLFPSLPTFLDSGIWNRLDYPVSSGAFEYPSSVGEIVTIKGLSNVLGD